MSLKAGVVSAGSWGTALAALLADKKYDVRIWARENEIVDSINSQHENKLFLPGIELPENLVATEDISQAVHSKDLVVMATPAQFLRESLRQISFLVSPGTYIVLASKGIEKGTLKTMHQVAIEMLPPALHRNVFVISGPTFARELAQKVPTCAVVAGYDQDSMGTVQSLFNTDYMRIYRSADVTGVELGGALKNIYAIAVGILEGMQLGKNAQAALITRAIAEISRLVIALGGNPMTISGLSGIGDLVLTCTGSLSRNRQVGIRLGQGEKINNILDSMIMVAEGVPTTASAYDLSKKAGVEMPIVENLYSLIYGNADIKSSIKNLMSRSLKDELETYGGN